MMRPTNHARKLSRLTALLLAGLALNSTAWAVAGYTITDLGTLGGGSSYATSISDTGWVAGYSQTARGQNHAFLYNGHTMSDLGTLGGPDSTATANFGGGYAAGYSTTSGGQRQGFVYGPSSMTNIGPLLGDAYGSAVWGMNPKEGWFVGEYYPHSGGDFHAFLWQGGAMTDLGTLGGSHSSAYGINASNQVVGSAFTAGNAAEHAFLYSGGNMTDLGTLGGTYSGATAINDKGQIVGYSSNINNSGYARSFLYDNGGMIDLGSLLTGNWTTIARDINNNGQVVGRSGYLPFLYNNGAMQNLNSLIDSNSGWVLADATGINDLGQIVGSGIINGQVHGYILTPTSSISGTEPPITMPPTSTVPVPAAAWLLGSGLLGLIGVARRKMAW